MELSREKKEEEMNLLREGILQGVSWDIQNENVDLVIKALEQDGTQYGNASPDIWYNHDAGLASVRNGGEYRYLNAFLRRDKEILLEAMLNENKEKFAWNRIPRKLQYDDDIIKASEHPELIPEILQELRDEMEKVDWANKEDVLRIMKKNGFTIEYANPELYKDVDFILRAHKIDDYAFSYADNELWQQKEFVIDAAKIDGEETLKRAEKYRDDKEIVLEAVKQNGEALYYSTECKKDREIVMEAVKTYGSALKWAEEYQGDKEIALEAVKQYSDAAEFVSEDLRKDPEIALEFLKMGCNLRYINKELLQQEEFLLKTLEINDECVESYITNPSQDVGEEFILEAMSRGFDPERTTRIIEALIITNSIDSYEHQGQLEVLYNPYIKKAQENPELIPEILEEFRKKKEEHTPEEVAEGISPREGVIKEVLDETIEEQDRVNNPEQKKEGETIGNN